MLIKKYKKTIVVSTVFLITIVVLLFISNPRGFQSPLSEPSRYGVFFDKNVYMLDHNKEFIAGTKNLTQDELEVFTMREGLKGIKRLSFIDLMSWNQLRIKLANSNDQICSGFWTGKIDHGDLINSLDALSDKDLQQFIEINIEAIKRETSQTPYIAPISGLQEGIQVITAYMEESEFKRMQKVLNSGTEANDEDACWLIKKMLDGVKYLSNEQKEKFLRSIAAL